MNEKSDAWSTGNLGLAGAAPPIRHHPSELMLRVMFSGRYSGLEPLRPAEAGEAPAVIDIGALYANNLVPFSDRGWRCFGTEINADMVAIARRAAQAQGVGADIREGANRALPFDDASMDAVLSLNVIHYEDDADGLAAAFSEYARVLKPGGRAFIVSAGPGHHVRHNAERLGPNRYRIAAEDFRKGQVMAYFEDLDDLKTKAGEAFQTVVGGRLLEEHPEAQVDFLYVAAVR